MKRLIKLEEDQDVETVKEVADEEDVAAVATVMDLPQADTDQAIRPRRSLLEDYPRVLHHLSSQCLLETLG